LSRERCSSSMIAVCSRVGEMKKTSQRRKGGRGKGCPRREFRSYIAFFWPSAPRQRKGKFLGGGEGGGDPRRSAQILLLCRDGHRRVAGTVQREEKGKGSKKRSRRDPPEPIEPMVTGRFVERKEKEKKSPKRKRKKGEKGEEPSRHHLLLHSPLIRPTLLHSAGEWKKKEEGEKKVLGKKEKEERKADPRRKNDQIPALESSPQFRRRAERTREGGKNLTLKKKRRKKTWSPAAAFLYLW